MHRNILRVPLVLLSLVLAVCVPFISSGFSELHKAETAESYLDVATHYRNAAQRLPWRAELYELAGHAYFHAGEYARADEMYRTAFEKHALTPDGWAAWGDVNFLNEDPTRAIEIWKQALEQEEPSENLYSRLAYAAEEQHLYTEAARYLKIHVTNKPDDASAHYRLGLLLTLTDLPASLSEIATASQLDPQFDAPAQTLRSALNLALLTDSPSERFIIVGNGLGLINEWKLAHAVYESAVQIDAENAEAWAWLGEAKQQLGEARSDELDRALALNPSSPVVRGLRGLYFQRMGNYRNALTEYEVAVALDPNNPARFVSMGDMFVYLGDLVRALEAYQTATVLDPENGTTWRALANFCARNNVYVKEIGIPAAQRALVIEGDSVTEDLLGWLWLLDGSSSNAERHLLRAIELDSQNAMAYSHLGMVYLQTGDRTRAFEQLIRARDLGSADAEALLNQFFP